MKVLIIGGGPAGMMAAISASKFKNEVILVEQNEKLGKKLFITGKGRCNVTNDCGKEEFFKNIVHNSKFMFSSFNNFSNKHLQNFLIDNGCKLKIERGKRVFPESDKSYDITDCLKHILNKQKVKIMLKTKVIDVMVKKNSDENILEIDYVIVKNIQTKNIDKIEVDKLIIATGGMAYPITGSTGDGYKFAEKLSANIIKPRPSLVPLKVEEIEDCKIINGLTLKNVSIKFYNDILKKNNILYKDFGEMNFTDFGLSGPIILSASCYIDKFPCKLSIDLKPALTYEQLDARVIREISENGNSNLTTMLENLLPKILVEIFIKRLKKITDNAILNDVNGVKCSLINKFLRKNIVGLLKNFEFTIIGTRNFDEAIITRGGIDVKCLNPKNMELKNVKGVHFAGEVVDVDCLTGGFNIQVVTSMGYTAGLD